MPSDAPLYSLMSVLADRPMLTLSHPELEHVWDFDDAMQPYLWSRTFEDVKNDPMAVFYTSGSTVLPPPVPLTADHANDMLVNLEIESSIMPPSILAEIAENHEYLKNLCQCSNVVYGGGPLFISSIGSVLGKAGGQVTEEIAHDWLRRWATQSQNFYDCCRHWSEVKSVIRRVRQLGGVSDHELWEDEVPRWPEKEWVPTMLASSIQLGAIPSSLGLLDKIDWLPVDVSAATRCELTSATTAVHDMCHVYNIVNPQTTTRKVLLPEFGAYKDLKKVSLVEWLALVKAHIETGQESYPSAAGLLDFSEGAQEANS
ncbi:hypothetical protein E4T39_04960 [Aureobasidium subglaciale]|nr:hypothetical protein E4T39_04960 [Aureobasidium subglaciale]